MQLREVKYRNDNYKPIVGSWQLAVGTTYDLAFL